MTHYILNEEDFHDLQRAFTALDTLHILMFETDQYAVSDPEKIASVMSFPIEAMHKALGKAMEQ